MRYLASQPLPALVPVSYFHSCLTRLLVIILVVVHDAPIGAL
jgi:hypothetical protein